MRQNFQQTILNLAHFLDHYFLLIFPTAVIAIERDWELGYGEALALGTPMYVALALATLPAGWLGDRLSRQWLIGAFFIGCGGAGISTGLATSPAGLAIGLTLLGACAAIYHPVGLAMVTECARRPGRALAINGVYGNLGLAGAAVATGWLADQFGWRSAFLIPGLVSVAVGTVYLFSIRRSGIGHKAGLKTSVRNHKARDRVVQIRVMTFVIAAALFGGAVFNAVTVSLPKLFDERLLSSEVDLSDLGAYVAMVFTIAAFAQLPVGDILDRFGARILLAVLLPVQVASLVIIANTDGPLVIPVATLLVLMLFAEIPVTAWLLGQYVAPNWRARAFSVEYMLSLGVGAAIVPAIAWGYESGIGFDRQYLVLGAASSIVFAAVLVLPAWEGTQRIHRTRTSHANGTINDN